MTTGQGVGDDRAAGAPGERLDLPRGVHDTHWVVGGTLSDQLQNLVETGAHEVEAGNDGAIWTEPVFFHHLLVLDSVADVHIGRVGDLNSGSF